METVPDVIEATGISKEYAKAFGPLNLFLRARFEGASPIIREFSRKNLVAYRFRAYREWFRPETFGTVVNDRNRGAVERLDAIVGELNRLAKVGEIAAEPPAESLSPAERLFDQAMEIVLDAPDFSVREICRRGELLRYFA